MSFILFVLMLGVAVWLGWRVLEARSLPGQPEGVSRASWEELLRACRGDATLAQRLWSYEKRRTSRLSEDEACRAASWRLQRDKA